MARLLQIHEGQREFPAIVFLHGLGGDLIETWRNEEASQEDCWLHWVGQDSGCDTWTLGYDSELSAWKEQAMSLPFQAGQVADLMASTPALQQKELVLVGHSMGGLVIKTLLVDGMTQGDARKKALAERVRGVVFLATPHHGSQLASLAQALGGLLRTNPQVGNLQNHDPYLQKLNLQFRNYSTQLGLATRCYTEQRDVTWTAKTWWGWRVRTFSVRVVTSTNSDPGLPGIVPIDLAEDHFSICKPKRDSQVHGSLLDFLRSEIFAPRNDSSPAQASTRSAGQRREPTADARSPERKPPAQLGGPDDPRLSSANGRFYGRENAVAQVLRFLRDAGSPSSYGSSACEVSGSGGIGKTEVCKAALKAWLAEYPAQKAYYLALPNDTTVADLVDRMAKALGLSGVERPDQLLESVLPGLYYLDNLEHLADQRDGRDLLQCLKEVPGVRLLASSRLMLPGVFRRSIAVDTLPRDAALKLFRDIWTGAGALPADDELSAFVMSELGGHPLSVVLCARLGDCWPYDDLRQRWKQEGTATAQDPCDGDRLNSLTASLRITAKALSQRAPQALGLWVCCAVFQSCLDTDVLAAVEKASGWSEGRQLLVRHHVLSLDSDARWHLLPPLARYALDAALKNQDGFEWKIARVPLRSLIRRHVDDVAALSSSQTKQAARRWLKTHFDAVIRFLRLEQGCVDHESKEWVRAVAIGLQSEYQFNMAHSPSFLRELALATDCSSIIVKRLGDLEKRLGRVDEARILYDRALAEAERHQDQEGQAKALLAKGDLEAHLGSVDEARTLYNKSLAEFEQLQNSQGQASVLKMLGDLEGRLGGTPLAKSMYDRALALYKKEKVELGVANTLRALGDLECRAGQNAEARALYDAALRKYELEHDSLGMANTLKALGDLECESGSFDIAIGLYEEAFRHYEREQFGLGQANTLVARSELELLQGRLAESQRLLDQALVLFEHERENLGRANTLQLQGDLLFKEARWIEAAERYQLALSLYLREKEPSGAAYALTELARCSKAAERPLEAEAFLERAVASAALASVKRVSAFVLDAVRQLEVDKVKADAWIAVLK